ncbi:hypothetical protein N7497_006390 [Penicillium chrysogenum]|jgi:hypothetical protein|uniref:D-arabinono-1,4-lactone oxidase C-terminal domain-containing protein n=1 Tax=Penicillium chrysogenum TaxID=5076 RepID=A0ABQ8W659_PENCH|nr:hypothetical protein N7505_011311 [Penicillium chrysogenum]KAJ6152071.1 hypothetical protein N7497_006390 [Penicillium chrysogenum]
MIYPALSSSDGTADGTTNSSKRERDASNDRLVSASGLEFPICGAKYNLQPNASGIFATLEYSWIPAYNNFTTQYFLQELASEYIPKFGETYNVRPHWNKMIFHNETYSFTIHPKMNDWVHLQKRMDPNCQFINEFLAESLGIDRCQYLFD